MLRHFHQVKDKNQQQSHKESKKKIQKLSLLMVGVQRTGAGQGPGWAGLWTGEVILHCDPPRGTHDLRTERRAKEVTNEQGKGWKSPEKCKT